MTPGRGGRVVALGAISASARHAAAPDVSSDTLNAVNTCWASACAENPSLHDSPILCVQRVDRTDAGARVEGLYLPYRFCYAAARLSHLDLKFEALGVAGFTLVDVDTRPSVALGKRASSVSWYPGLWEFLSSGGVDAGALRPDGSLDLRGMLLRELDEEVGVPASAIRDITPVGLIYDVPARTYDALLRLTTTWTSHELVDAAATRAEYDEVQTVPLDELRRFVSINAGDMIPPAQAAVEALAALDRRIL